MNKFIYSKIVHFQLTIREYHRIKANVSVLVIYLPNSHVVYCDEHWTDPTFENSLHGSTSIVNLANGYVSYPQT